MTDGMRPGEHLLDLDRRAERDSVAVEPQRPPQLLLAALTEGDVLALRFLETTGVLERALPELAAAVDRRRNDPFLLDPAQVLRFSLVERIRRVAATDPLAAAEYPKLQHPDWLLLAALILDTAGDDASPVELARRIAHRLDLGATAEQQIALLVDDADLLRAAARRFDGLEEERVMPIATHLDNAERARALYLLTLARDELTPSERTRLDSLYRFVLSLGASLGHRSRGAQPRGTAALRSDPRRRTNDPRRRAHRGRAPLVPPEPGRGWTWLAKPRSSIRCRHEAKQASRPSSRARTVAHRSRGPRPARAPRSGRGGNRRGRVRHPRRGRRHLARRRRPRHLPGPAHRRRTPERDRRFGVRSSRAARSGQDRSRDRRRVPTAFRSTPNPEAEIGFDDHASPWYTIAEVRSPDRPGLLQDLAAAMTSAGVNVHSARLLSTAGTAVDRFELTDTNGRKLDDPSKAGAIRAVHEGAAAKRTRSRWWKAAPLAFAGRRSPG